MQPTFVDRHREPCFVVEGALSAAACDALVARAAAIGFSATGLEYPPSYRDNDRLVLDDPALAREMSERLRMHLPPEIVEPGGARLTLVGINSRFRFCRYRHGQKFCVHQDGAFEPNDDERSVLTCQISLSSPSDFAGGHTRFYASRTGEVVRSVRPARGSAIVFRHDVWHDGEAVTDGEKIVFRMDVIYRRTEKTLLASAPDEIARHRGYVFSVLPLRSGSIATGGRDRMVLVTPVRCGDAVALAGHESAITALAELDDGTLVTGSRDRTIRRARLDSCAPRLETVAARPGAVLALCALGGRLFAVGDGSGRIAIFDGDHPAHAFAGHDGWVWSLDARRDRIASASEDGTVALWDLAGRCRSRLGIGGGPVFALRWLDDHVLAVGSADGRVGIVSADGDRLERRSTFRAHDGGVYALAPAAGGFVSGGEDGMVRRFDLEGRCIARAPLGTFVRAIRELDGDRFVVGAYDGRARRVTLSRE